MSDINNFIATKKRKMKEKEHEHCFLCEELSDEISFQYTEPICEDCLNFKGLTRIEAVIGNKRRLNNKGVSVEVSPSLHQLRKRNIKTSADTYASVRKLLSGKRFISKTKKAVLESQMEKGSGESSSSLELPFDSMSLEKVTVHPECKLNSTKENCLGFIIPLPYKEVDVFKNDSSENELNFQVSLLTKFQQEQLITENFARAALGALKCSVSNKKLSLFSALEHSTSTFDINATKKLNLKRCGSDSGSTSRKK